MKFPILAKQGTKIPIILAEKGTKTPDQPQDSKKPKQSAVQRFLNEPIKSAVFGNQFYNTDPEVLKQYADIATDFVPIVGDVKEAVSIAKDFKDKNYLPAILGTTLFLLPGNIPQIVKKLPKGIKNAIKIETFLPERLESGAIKRTHLPEKVNNKPIQEAMLDIPFEMGDSKGKGALYDFKNNKIILDDNLKESLYTEVIPHE